MIIIINSNIDSVSPRGYQNRTPVIVARQPQRGALSQDCQYTSKWPAAIWAQDARAEWRTSPFRRAYGVKRSVISSLVRVALRKYIYREFRDVVFEDVVFDNNSYVTPYKVNQGNNYYCQTPHPQIPHP